MISWTSQVLEHICEPKFLDVVLPRRSKVKSGWVQTSNSSLCGWLDLVAPQREVRAVIQVGPYRGLSSRPAFVTLEQ